jgi:FMN phosphatase YigB (HAD superfamily)
MLFQAQRDFGLDLFECYLVGDVGAWDMVLARSVGCRAILVHAGLERDRWDSIDICGLILSQTLWQKMFWRQLDGLWIEKRKSK